LGDKVKTRPYGEIDVDERQVFSFPDGIPGFDFVRKFVLLDTQDASSPFKWLQACDEPDLAFVVIRPVDFLGEYELVISQGDMDAVSAKSADELLVLAIVTIPANPADMTANLQGPVILNPVKRLGRQVISLSDRYQVRHRIMDEMKKISGTGR
jgi:flagellar assembly factor FliW